MEQRRGAVRTNVEVTMDDSGALPLPLKANYYKTATHLSNVVLETVSDDLTHPVNVFVSDKS